MEEEIIFRGISDQTKPVMIARSLVAKILGDDRISWGAKGVLFVVYCHMEINVFPLDKVPDFELIEETLTAYNHRASPDNEEIVLGYVDELMRFGYINCKK